MNQPKPRPRAAARAPRWSPSPPPRAGAIRAPRWRSRLRRWLPHGDKVRHHRLVAWIGPAIHHPRLWHINRQGVALGLAIGLFFGFLIPVAQIPFAAIFAVWLRANLLVAVGSTLVTNPFTFGPVYFAAWHVGGWVLGERAPPPLQIEAEAEAEPSQPWWRSLLGVGKPLVVGLAIFAVAAGVGVYLLITWVWWARTHCRRR